jgi:cell wall-associated NlpC family hydrolase
MGPAALIKWSCLLLALGLALPLHADLEQEEHARRLARADNAIWQAFFGQRVLHEAKKQLGKPYVWGAKDGEQGFDCSGLTAYVYGTLGVPIAINALGQFVQGSSIERAALLPGDLVFFTGQGSPLHVGIYVGDNEFYHAPGTGKVIQSSSLDEPYFKRRYLGARRLTPALDEAHRQRAQASIPHPQDPETPSKEKAP